MCTRVFVQLWQCTWSRAPQVTSVTGALCPKTTRVFYRTLFFPNGSFTLNKTWFSGFQMSKFGLMMGLLNIRSLEPVSGAYSFLASSKKLPWLNISSESSEIFCKKTQIIQNYNIIPHWVIFLPKCQDRESRHSFRHLLHPRDDFLTAQLLPKDNQLEFYSTFI